MLNIIICAKVMFDPEAPISTFRIDPEAKRAIPGKGVPPVLNPYDENCLEAALRIKELHPSKITVISMGKDLPKAVVKKSLAAGADELVLLEDDIFENLDGCATAYALAAAIKKIGEYDLILTGRQAADTNAGQVGSGIAEILAIPSVTVAQKVELVDGKVRVERVVLDGYEVVEAPLPCLITVSHELGDLRSPSMQEFVAAQKKPVTTWKAQDLEVEPSAVGRSKLLELFMPEKEAKCQMVEGETPEEAGANLALKLRESKII
ncbi:MAG: electron transfer flavoprotein subunit beta/FixA family protein [Dehalococcoidia bacterium]|jgi:electron transfer flavoprotein beta subunit|nr:electron transfer flavoprotein subunit beta/FixA family protein [Chloroflexota bacterium]MCK4242125.1 electron transfer flavoprotein subunit beta/FixA family protein [Dehalococcoidia bacterium]